jgi:RNA polymerase sigma factor (sigma-70 family)
MQMLKERVDGTAAAVGESVSDPLPAGDGEKIDAGTLYVQHRPLLLFVASRKFGVPEADAENLIHEVFVSFLQTQSTIHNIRAWLVAAVCNASRYYWRVNGRSEPLPDDINDYRDPHSNRLADDLAMRMTVQQALNYLAPACRETIRLHYFEGRSASDIAVVLNTTNRYAEKLIHKCLKRARAIYLKITAVTR